MADAYTQSMPGSGPGISLYVRGGHVPGAVNTQAQVVFAAPGARKRYVFNALRWSSSATPAAAISATISDGTNTETVQITAAGPGFMAMDYHGLENATVTFTVPATASVACTLAVDGYVEVIA